MRAFGSMTFTFTGTENLYISQVQVTCLPASNRPLPLLNQNLDVMAGFTNASNTSATGLRMSISALAIGFMVTRCRPRRAVSTRILCDARLDQFLHQCHGQRLFGRETNRALAGFKTLQSLLKLLLHGRACRIERAVILPRAEVNEWSSVEFEPSQPVADVFHRSRRG